MAVADAAESLRWPRCDGPRDTPSPRRHRHRAESSHYQQQRRPESHRVDRTAGCGLANEPAVHTKGGSRLEPPAQSALNAGSEPPPE